MNSIRWIFLILLGTIFTTGCADYYQKRTIQASGTDLNQVQDMSSKILDGKVGGVGGWLNLTTAYNLSGVRYSSVDPLFGPEVSAVTTALVVQSGGLKALEFGSGGSRSSTTQTYFSDINRNLLFPYAQDWSSVFADSRNTFDQKIDVTFSLMPTLVTIKDTGSDAILGWGRWTGDAYMRKGVIQAGCCSENKSAHYVFGAATSDSVIKSMPRGFTSADVVTFSLIGASSPTLADGSFAPGTLNATTSKVGVLWGGASALPKIGVELYGTINNLPFTVKSLGGASTPMSTNIVYNPATLSFSGNNQFVDGSKVSGFFAGKDATHIGLTYTASVQGFTTTPAIREVQGVAAFKR